MKNDPHNSHRYRNIRKRLLAENPICNVCNIEPATQIHHIKPLWGGGDLLAEANLVPICKSCHKKLQARLPRRKRGV